MLASTPRLLLPGTYGLVGSPASPGSRVPSGSPRGRPTHFVHNYILLVLGDLGPPPRFPRDGGGGVSGRLTDEDIMLWERVTQGDQVLPGRHYSKRADGIQVHLSPLLKKPDKAVLPQSTRAKLVHVSRALQGTGLDKRTSTRLRRGQIAIDSRLDLHGLTQAEAKAFLHTV